ncbi:MAG: 50S ribosomal protein L29 [Brevinemataceae bacterium]
MNKIQQLRSLSDAELVSMRKDLQDKIMQIRFRSKIEPPKDITQVRKMKRTIARINTLIRQAELKEIQ